MSENYFLASVVLDLGLIILKILIGIILFSAIIRSIETKKEAMRFFATGITAITFCFFMKTALADDIIMQKHSYSEEYEISEKHDSIRKLEQYIKYREIELNDLKSEIKTEKEEVIIEALEEKAKDISQNIQFSKYALEQIKLGKSARIEYKQ